MAIFVVLYLVGGVLYYLLQRSSEGPMGIGNAFLALMFGGFVVAFIFGLVLPIGLIGGFIAWLNEKI